MSDAPEETQTEPVWPDLGVSGGAAPSDPPPRGDDVVIPNFPAADPETDAASRDVELSPIPEGVPLALAGVELSPEGVAPAIGTVTLTDVATGRRLDIIMGRPDAALLEEAIAGIAPPRPRPHDLMLAAIEALDGVVVHVSLVERRPGGIYVARVDVAKPDGSIVSLDARPSDALNLALRAPAAALWATSELLGVLEN